MPPRLHADQVDIDEPLVRRLLQHQLPELAPLPLHQVASGGTDNAVFRLGDELAVRLPKSPGAVGGLVKEIRWLPVVAPYLSLDVPEVVATGEPDEGYPFPWAVVRWLPGADAASAPFSSADDAAAALAGFVRELRQVDPVDVPPPGSAGFSRGLPLARRDEDVRSALARCAGLLDVGRVSDLWDDALAAPVWTGPPVWLHADLLPTNLLVRDGRLAGVLDFGAMATGDPAYDVTPGWQVFDGASRTRFLSGVAADEATRRRARGLVLSVGVIALPYYLHTNPTMVAIARRGVEAVLGDA